MELVSEGKIGKKGALYPPKRLFEALGLKNGSRVRYTVRDGKLVVESIPDPFELAIEVPKFAETTIEEFEKESEEMQRELIKRTRSH